MEDNLNNEFAKTFHKSLIANIQDSMISAAVLYRSVLLSDHPEYADECWKIYLSVRDLYETLLKNKNCFI